MEELFEGEKHEGEFLKFDRVLVRHSSRPDLHAFILLDLLLPNQGTDIVSSSEHDQIWIGVDAEELAKVITEERIVELVRCGIRYDREYGSLCSFV